MDRVLEKCKCSFERQNDVAARKSPQCHMVCNEDQTRLFHLIDFLLNTKLDALTNYTHLCIAASKSFDIAIYWTNVSDKHSRGVWISANVAM